MKRHGVGFKAGGYLGDGLYFASLPIFFVGFSFANTVPAPAVMMPHFSVRSVFCRSIVPLCVHLVAILFIS